MICLIALIIIFITSISASNYEMVITPSGKQFLKVGDTLTINCRISPMDHRNFMLKLALPLSSAPLEDRIKIVKAINNLTVTIHSMQTQDTGWYTCDTPDNDFMAKTIYVSVQEEYGGGCPSKNFSSCGDKRCIPIRYVCDGFTDCPNNKDESEEVCGVNPCDNKIMCEDGRCIAKTNCCNRSLDPHCPVINLVPCCQDYFNHLANIKPVNDMTSKDNLIRSTIYTIVSCAIAVFFFVAILIVAIYRVHMRRSLLMVRTSPSTINSFGSIPQRNAHHCVYDDTTNDVFESLDPIDLEMAYNQYESDDMMLSISQIPKPPLYSEALSHPVMPYNEPPPPYSPKSTPTSVMSPEFEGTSSTSDTPEDTSYVLVIPLNTCEDSENTNENNSSRLT